METRIIDIAARKICGVGRSTRIEAPHFLAGTWSYANYYTQHCAVMVDACLRVTNRTVQKRITEELRVYDGAEEFKTHMINISLP